MPEKETSEKPEKPPWSPVPESKAGKAAFFFFSQLVSYFLLAANFRAIAKGYYLYTASTDLLIAFQGIVVTKLMIEDKRSRDWVVVGAYTLGGAFGSLLSIWLTKKLYGG
jgi:hypothetical protein